MPKLLSGLPRALGVVLLLFAGVYTPAFLTVKLLKLRPGAAVPVVLAISLGMALLLIGFLSRRGGWFGEFGFLSCGNRYLVLAVALGAPLGWAATVLIHNLSSGAAHPEFAFRPWVQVGYFVLGAAIQEEVIFRGLLQTALKRRLAATLSFRGYSLSWPAILVAILFGLIHLSLNPITAAMAFVLGMLAGELRQRSGSLLPAIVVHSLFNLFAFLL